MAAQPNFSFDAVLDILAEKVAERLRIVSPDPAGEPKLLSIKEAAKRISCSPSSIRNLITSGSLPQRILRRFGRRVLLDREEFDKWVSAR